MARFFCCAGDRSIHEVQRQESTAAESWCRPCAPVAAIGSLHKVDCGWTMCYCLDAAPRKVCGDVAILVVDSHRQLSLHARLKDASLARRRQYSLRACTHNQAQQAATMTAAVQYRHMTEMLRLMHWQRGLPHSAHGLQALQ